MVEGGELAGQGLTHHILRQDQSLGPLGILLCRLNVLPIMYLRQSDQVNRMNVSAVGFSTERVYIIKSVLYKDRIS